MSNIYLDLYSVKPYARKSKLDSRTYDYATNHDKGKARSFGTMEDITIGDDKK